MLMVGDLVRLSNEYITAFVCNRKDKIGSVNSWRRRVFRIVELRKPTKKFVRGNNRYFLLFNQVATLDKPHDGCVPFAHTISTHFLRLCARPKKVQTIRCDRPVRELDLVAR